MCGKQAVSAEARLWVNLAGLAEPCLCLLQALGAACGSSCLTRAQAWINREIPITGLLNYFFFHFTTESYKLKEITSFYISISSLLGYLLVGSLLSRELIKVTKQ